MTHKLYYDDAYIQRFEARVLDVQNRADGPWLALDRTAFYPTGGGQPHDEGTLTAGDMSTNVTDVLADGEGRIWHGVDALLPQGAYVQGHIDWARRFDHMQQHGGEHILAGSVKLLFDGYTHGLHIGRDISTIDITMPDGRTRLTDEELTQLETLANERVQTNAPIKAWFPEASELQALPLRKDPTVQEHVRVIAVGDFEYCACGGTHPSATGQIGVIKVLESQPARGKLRLSFVCGMRAVRLNRSVYLSASEAGRLLSAPPEHLAREVGNRLQELQRQREQLSALRLELAAEEAEKLAASAVPLPGGGRLCAGHFPALDADSLRDMAGRLILNPNMAALLSAPREGGVVLLFARGAQAPGDMAALLRQAGARGGGKPDWAQGSAAGEETVRRAAALLESGLDAAAWGATPMTGGQRTRLQFWQGFIRRCAARGRAADIAQLPPAPEYWYDIPIGKRGYHITLHCLVQKEMLRAGLYFFSSATYSNYYLQRAAAADIVGQQPQLPEDPRPRPGMGKVLMSFPRPADLGDRNSWEAYYDWLIFMHDRLRQVIDRVDP